MFSRSGGSTYRDRKDILYSADRPYLGLLYTLCTLRYLSMANLASEGETKTFRDLSNKHIYRIID